MPPAADLVRCTVRAAGNDVILTIETAKAYDYANTQVLLDTDRSAKTGWTGDGAGADLLIEGANLFAFKGQAQANWTWDRVGDVQRSVARNRLVVRIRRSRLPDAKFEFVVRTLTDSYALLDRLPDSGGVAVDIKELEAENAEGEKPTEATGDAADAARDLIEVGAEQKKSRIEVSARTQAASDFAQLLVFFDTDRDAKTGYRSDAAPGFGFDVLLSGGRVHRFNGAQQKAWTWEGLEDARVEVADNRYHADFDAHVLDTTRAAVVFMMMSADWQSVMDAAPDAGAIELQLDATQVGLAKPPIAPADPRANRNDPPRRRFADAKSFYCYYGSGKVAALSHYDVVITHSPQMQPADIAQLRQLGVVVIGYLTVGEDDKLRKANGRGPGGYASWYLDADSDGEPDQNGVWKSYYVDPGDPAWRADRVSEARRLIEADGYDGIFLDTLDTATAFPKTEPGMIKLVSELRGALPDAPIVLNQGFRLLARLAPFADGLMIESFTATYDFREHKYVLHTPSSLDWTRGIAERTIEPVVAEHGLKVLVLDYAPPDALERIQTAADRAATFGFLFAAAPIYLDAVYDTGVVGHPDAKWRKQQATPDALRYTLPADANGFPKGTTLTPSSCFGGYEVASVVDGVEDRSALHWSRAAWASAEDGAAAWLELRFPIPLSDGVLQVRWATDSGRLRASRNFQVQVERGHTWTTIDHVEDNTREFTNHKLPNAPFNALRILQPAGGGCSDRPDLMWIAQITRRSNV